MHIDMYIHILRWTLYPLCTCTGYEEIPNQLIVYKQDKSITSLTVDNNRAICMREQLTLSPTENNIFFKESTTCNLRRYVVNKIL